VPWIWKVGMAVLVACLIASMAIAIVRLVTTPTEVGPPHVRGLRVSAGAGAPAGRGGGR
jgi:hypothetical protein